MQNFDFNIIGAGALGHLWASFLCHAGFSVALYSRNEKASQVFQLVSPLGDFQFQADYHLLSDWQNARFNIICVKAHQLEPLCLQLKNAQIELSNVLLLMNGMGLIEIVRQKLPRTNVFHASTTHGAFIQDTKILHTGQGETLIGDLESKLNQSSAPSKFAKLIQSLDLALPKVSWNGQHSQQMHLKLIVNAIINPLTAVSNQPNGSILTNGQLNHAASELLDEIKPFLPQLTPKLNFNQVKQAIEQVAGLTQNNISSMLQDTRNNRPTEIDYINGYLVKFAARRGSTMKAHERLIQQIKNITQTHSSSTNPP